MLQDGNLKKELYCKDFSKIHRIYLERTCSNKQYKNMIKEDEI